MDSRNRLWIGTNDNGLALMERGEIRFWGEKDGLGASKVSTLAEATDGSIYVGSKGVVRITLDLTLQHVDTPMLDEMVIESLKAGTDGLVYGITNEDDLFLLKDGGLPYISTSNSYCELTSEGILYLSGSAGVSQVNINKSDREIDDIRMAIPYVDADGVRIYPDETNGFVLPGDVKKLTIHCYAFTYSVGDLQVDYCLEGFDHGPVTVNRSELGPVS